MTIPNDPESEGIPDIADDDSSAYDDANHPVFDDSPPKLPTDQPVSVDDYGVTGYESSRDEPLSARLVREQGDISPDDPRTAAIPFIADEAVTDDMLAQAARDADVFEAGEESVDLDERPVGYVGRLVEPGEGGSFEDDEAQVIAYDSGEREGLSPEESAMHEVRDRDVPYYE